MNMESKNTVFVGGKPTAVYVTAAVVISKNYDEVFFVARGKKMLKAIDACFMAKRNFLKEWTIKSTEVLESPYEINGNSRYVSSIKLVLIK